MAENERCKKMRLKPGMRAAILNAPPGYLAELVPLPENVELLQSAQGQFDWVQLFVQTKAELEAALPRALPALKPESFLWISFPKGSSKMQTDLTRDKGWEGIRATDLKWVTLISVNATWSAFGFRLLRAGEERQMWSS